MYDDDVEQFNATELAKQVMSDWLISKFQDADLLDIMNADPDCVDLTTDEWEAVREALYDQRQVFIKID